MKTSNLTWKLSLVGNGQILISVEKGKMNHVTKLVPLIQGKKVQTYCSSWGFTSFLLRVVVSQGHLYLPSVCRTFPDDTARGVYSCLLRQFSCARMSSRRTYVRCNFNVAYLTQIFVKQVCSLIMYLCEALIGNSVV
jgi:hypothetical protein